VEEDFYRTAIEDIRPSAVVFQVDSSVYHSKTTRVQTHEELLSEFDLIDDEQRAKIQKMMLPNIYPECLDDVTIDYDSIDSYLKKLADTKPNF